MISANDLRRVQLTSAANGYSVEEVNAVIDQAASTIEAYANENKELYHKMEVLASKIEEYRSEEDSIKTALITAQKMADKIKKESTDEAQTLVSDSKETAAATVNEAKDKADKIVSEARQYASDMLKEKTDEANSIVDDAEKKANEAISSSKIVAQNILDQAKEISEDLIEKSKEEKQAYEILIETLKKDAGDFISQLKQLYSEQLGKLETAKLDTDETAKESEKLDAIHSEVESLISESEEIADAIPDEISIEKTAYPQETQITATQEPQVLTEESLPKEPQDFSVIGETPQQPDPMAAVEAFSQDEITPIDTSRKAIPEIDEEPPMEKSLFDEGDKHPFENYFNVNTEDAHFDKTQQISLVPPEEQGGDGEDDSRRFGFFKKKK